MVNICLMYVHWYYFVACCFDKFRFTVFHDFQCALLGLVHSWTWQGTVSVFALGVSRRYSDSSLRSQDFKRNSEVWYHGCHSHCMLDNYTFICVVLFDGFSSANSGSEFMCSKLQQDFVQTWSACIVFSPLRVNLRIIWRHGMFIECCGSDNVVRYRFRPCLRCFTDGIPIGFRHGWDRWCRNEFW